MRNVPGTVRCPCEPPSVGQLSHGWMSDGHTASAKGRDAWKRVCSQRRWVGAILFVSGSRCVRLLVDKQAGSWEGSLSRRRGRPPGSPGESWHLSPHPHPWPLRLSPRAGADGLGLFHRFPMSSLSFWAVSLMFVKVLTDRVLGSSF